MATTTRWTNRSVVRFAGDGDPVSAITEHARTVVAEAMDRGWSGPPFDPIAIAELLHLDVIPSSDVQDARTITTPDGRACIEYNPNRPPGRMRYSIAHEIAHTFFPDCADRPRHRAARAEVAGDDWQLEALCNIGAAELLMPLGRLPQLKDSDLNVDNLMQLRGEYQVSTEAMFIRAVSITETPSAMFCAHRIEEGRNAGRYRLDYVIPSNTWSPRFSTRGLLSPDSVVTECTAIGYTAKHDEEFAGTELLHVECVGVPPYPGSAHPRVVGVVLPIGETTSADPPILYLKGNVLEPRGDGPKIIAHVVNNRTLNWGGNGVAVALRKKWPEAQAAFREWGRTRKLSRSLGEVCIAEVERDVTVASIVAQVGYGESVGPRIRYAALKTALREVCAVAAREGATLHIPRLGCGQAGGAWEVVRDILFATACAAGVRVVVYDPPDSPAPQTAQTRMDFSTP